MIDSAAVTQAFMAMRDVGTHVLDAAAGHRAEAERRGFESVICDQMAAQFHFFVLDTLMRRPEAKA